MERKNWDELLDSPSSVEEMYLRIPRNHRSSDDYQDDHNRKFHRAIALIFPTDAHVQMLSADSRGVITLCNLSMSGCVRPKLPSGWRSDLVAARNQFSQCSFGPVRSHFRASRACVPVQNNSDQHATSPSPKTSAVKPSIVAPRRQQSNGKPALRQVCSRNASRPQPCSRATCGSNNPRRPSSEISNPWRPISTASG